MGKPVDPAASPEPVSDSRGKQAGTLRLVTYLYFAVMAVLFVQQTYVSVNKYLKKEIIEEISIEHNLESMLPAMTFCFLPGYAVPARGTSWGMETFCDRNETDFERCINDILFDKSKFILSAFMYPDIDLSPPDFGEGGHWRPNSLNLFLGTCVTYQRRELLRLSQLSAQSLVFNVSANPHDGWSMMVFVHNDDAFMPANGMSSEYVGQDFVMVVPRSTYVSFLTVDVTHRENFDREDKRCENDEGYNVVRCMEDYIRNQTGCASPWDQFPNQQVPVCETFEEYESLFQTHAMLSTLGAPQYLDLTGCHSPCKYQDYKINQRDFKNSAEIGLLYPDADVFSLALSLRTTNRRVVRETLLYQMSNLVGEVGGCMGMFLGVSLITIYQSSLDAVRAAKKYI